MSVYIKMIYYIVVSLPLLLIETVAREERKWIKVAIKAKSDMIKMKSFPPPPILFLDYQYHLRVLLC